MNVTLHKQLVDACNLLNNAMSYENRIAVLEGEIQKYESKYQKMKKRGFRATPGVLRIIFIGGGAAVLLLVMAATISGDGVSVVLPNWLGLEPIDMTVIKTVAMYIGIGILTVVPVVLPCAALLYKFAYCNPKTKALQKEAQKYWDEVGTPACEKIRAQILVLRQEQKDYVSKNFDLISFVPDAYRNPRAVPFLEQVVRNGRADSLKEAINLYEEQLHRWALEDQARRVAEEAEWQSYNVRRQLIELQELQEKIKY